MPTENHLFPHDYHTIIRIVSYKFFKDKKFIILKLLFERLHLQINTL